MDFVEFSAGLPFSGVKNSSSVEFHSFPSTIDKAKAFVSVLIDEWIQYNEDAQSKRLTHACESRSEYNNYCVSIR